MYELVLAFERASFLMRLEFGHFLSIVAASTAAVVVVGWIYDDATRLFDAYEV